MTTHRSPHISGHSTAHTPSTVVAIVVAFILFRAIPAAAQQATTPILPPPARREAQIPLVYPTTKLAQRLPPIEAPSNSGSAKPQTATSVSPMAESPLVLPPLANSLQEYPITEETGAPVNAQSNSMLFAQETLPPGEGEATPAPSETVPTDPDHDINQILKRLDRLEQTLAAPNQENELDKEPEPSIVWEDLSDDKWTVRLGGHMQLDSINWADASPSIPEFNYVEFRRLRLLADGVGYGVYDFRLQIDIEPESSTFLNSPVVEIKDAYLTMNELPVLFRKARIGNFFVPFSLEQVTNDTNNLFLERSIPTAGIFTADREVGFAFYGVSDDLNTTWTTGFFADNVDEGLKERQDDNQGQRISGRLTHLLYYDEPSNGRYLVHTGVGVLATHDQDNQVRFRARPQIHEGPFLIDTGNMAAEDYQTGNIEFATVWGPWSLQSEAFYTNTNLDVGGNTPSWGMYVHSSYFLTGENRNYERFGQHGAQFARNTPYSNFFWVPGCCGPGAWEVKGRWSNLTLTDYGAGEYNDFTFGFNWYWTDRIRVMFDWIHPFTSPETLYGETQSDIIAMRFDYNF